MDLKGPLVGGIVRRAHYDRLVVFDRELNVHLARAGTAVGVTLLPDALAVMQRLDIEPSTLPNRSPTWKDLLAK